MKQNKDQQVREAVSGLAIGLYALEVSDVSDSKIELESALMYAWSRWPYSSSYPSIGRAHKPDNVLWGGIVSSSDRQFRTVIWERVQNRYFLTSVHPDRTAEELTELLGNRPLEHWTDLAKLFMERIGT